jgi:hypothetical protein
MGDSGDGDAEIERHLATIIVENMGTSGVNPDRARRTLAALRDIPVAV